jgi:PIN like domain
MAADPDGLRFYVDESALGLGKSLAWARKDTIHVGHPLIPECPLGTLDHDWIPAVAMRELIVIGRDRRIRTKPQELALFRDAGLRVFWIAGKRDMSTWDWLTRLVRHWDAIEREIADRGVGPWFYAVNDGGLREIPLP